MSRAAKGQGETCEGGGTDLRRLNRCAHIKRAGRASPKRRFLMPALGKHEIISPEQGRIRQSLKGHALIFREEDSDLTRIIRRNEQIIK